MTIDIGFAELDLGDFHIGIIDVPGHERFIKNMLAGATTIDMALLIVAADDSVMPQTREHLAILELLGIQQGVIALTKSIAKETADRNIAINCITPAAAKTRIFDQISQQHIDYMLSKIPRGRFVKVEEVAAMVAWLVSEENSFTTGAAFDLSGGRATY